MTETLLVVLHGEIAGELERATPYSEPTLRYSTAYLASGTVPLSLRLPPRAEPSPARLVTPYIEGLLPESRLADITLDPRLSGGSVSLVLAMHVAAGFSPLPAARMGQRTRHVDRGARRP